jgi:hypothetical protein
MKQVQGVGRPGRDCRRHGCRRQAYMDVFTACPARACPLPAPGAPVKPNPRSHSASKIPAAPMPVPMHIVTMPYLPPVRRSPWTMVAVRTAPVAPSG